MFESHIFSSSYSQPQSQVIFLLPPSSLRREAKETEPGIKVELQLRDGRARGAGGGGLYPPSISNKKCIK